MKTAVIILPTYNEAANIAKVIEGIFETTKDLKQFIFHILVVDSKSKDKTADIVKKIQKSEKNLHLLETEKEGLGKAYTQGFSYSIEKLKAYLVFEMDSDLSHNPKKIPDFIEQIRKGADFVVGSRYKKGGSIPSDWAIHRKLFSVVGNWIIRLGFMKLSITDWTSGFRAIKTWVIKGNSSYLDQYTGYVFQVAMLDLAIKSGAKVAETPINFTDRREGHSKINSFEFIVQTLMYVLKNSSFIKFVVVGATGFVLDFFLSYIFIDVVHWPVWVATAISTESAIISNFLMNNFWSFSHKRIKGRKRVYAKGFIKFNAIGLGSVVIQSTGMQILASIFGREYWYIFKVFIIIFIIIPYSYFFYNKIVWKDK